MNSSALVISDDIILRGDARRILGELRIDCVSSGMIGFKKAIASTKFDAVIIDCPRPTETIAAIQDVRTGKVNRYSIILTLVSDGHGAAAARNAGANFTIQRSSTIRADLQKAVQSAYGLILRERRRYERQPVDVNVDFLCNGRITTGRMVDISERGACVECSLSFPAQPLQLGFSLPGLSQRLRIEGVPAWTRGTKVGIQFTSFADSSQTALIEWLRNRLETPAASGQPAAIN